jgi:hypothetical protein
MPAWTQDTFVKPDLLNIEKIQNQEQLSKTSKVKRIYIFLAVHENNGYKFYVGRFELNPETKTLNKEPNNLKEYQEIGFIPRKILISENQHMCYISALPKFKELFPNHTYPFKRERLVEVPTKKAPDDQARLTGSKSLPLINRDGEKMGLEHFIAFYNLAPPQLDAEGKPVPSENNIHSYGFIEIKFDNS